MNFLAHLYLSGNFDQIMVGNFIADSVKGRDIQRYPDEIQKGILLHRKIDSYTDIHPVFCSSKVRLRTTQGKFSGVVTDIFYDHFLAVNWSRYSKIPLEEFAGEVYALLNMHHSILPPIIQYILPRMMSNNWLVNYANIAGIEKSLEGMARRTKFPSNMQNAASDLLKDYSIYQHEFLLFFEDIIQYVSEQNDC